MEVLLLLAAVQQQFGLLLGSLGFHQDLSKGVKLSLMLLF